MLYLFEGLCYQNQYAKSISEVISLNLWNSTRIEQP